LDIVCDLFNWNLWFKILLKKQSIASLQLALKRAFPSLILLFSLFFLLPINTAYAETITLPSTTPVPFGIYDQIRLVPRAQLTGACDIGTMYVQNPDNLQYCGSGGWVSGYGGAWTQASYNIYPTDTPNPSIKVSIGLTTPQFRFHIQDGGILATGGSETLTVTGAGTRLIWYPDKSAFRAGKVNGTQWDNGNIALYSAILGGENNLANQAWTGIVGGSGLTAGGSYGFVGGGENNTLSAFSWIGIVGGRNHLATGSRSIILGGENNRANGPWTGVAGGMGNTASGFYAVVLGGETNTAGGVGAGVSGGTGNAAPGNYAMVLGGENNRASDDSAVVVGGSDSIASRGTSADSRAVVLGGKRNTAGQADAAVVGGSNNTAGQSRAVVLGGQNNQATQPWAAVVGGSNNTAGQSRAVVLGGQNNQATQPWAAVVGGSGNMASQSRAAVLGGENNTAGGAWSIVVGGSGNTVSSAYSWVSGKNMRLSSTSAPSFVWGYSDTPITPITNSTNAFIVFHTSSVGRVGIGLTDPSAKLHVNGNIKANLTDLTTGLTPMEYNTSSREIGLDLAELFETSEEVEVGDLLIIDENAVMKLKKSTGSYDQKIAGVVSESPAILFEGSQLEIAPSPHGFAKGTKLPVALMGRVLSKVTNENGAIRAGDLLVPSSVPGHLMKATEKEKSNEAFVIVGKALESFSSGPHDEATGKIIMLVMSP